MLITRNNMPDKAESAQQSEGKIDSKNQKKVSFFGYEEIRSSQPPTSYLETLINLFKGNVGTGCFAMADAMKNGGIVLAPIVTIIIAVICIQCMHMLVRGAEYVMQKNELTYRPDYSDVVELSILEYKKSKKWKTCAIVLKRICNIAICITQLGFCCVYFLFVTDSIKIILDYYMIEIEFAALMSIVLIPIWLMAMLRRLKQIAIFSGVANVCMILGAIFTIAYTFQDLPNIGERKLANIKTLPLFFGTALFAFEGIALVLPLQNAMKEPQKFPKFFGVLNVGMVLVSTIYLVIGFLGYWKYGEATEASLTLNLPADQILAQVIILMVALGVMLGYPIQFFVAIQILCPPIVESTEISRNHPVISEILFRSFMILVTFAIAQIVPNLGLLLSLIGAVFCSALVFIFPAIIELATRKAQYDEIGVLYWIKNVIIMIISVAGMISGGAVSIQQIISEATKKHS